MDCPLLFPYQDTNHWKQISKLMIKRQFTKNMHCIFTPDIQVIQNILQTGKHNVFYFVFCDYKEVIVTRSLECRHLQKTHMEIY